MTLLTSNQTNYIKNIDIIDGNNINVHPVSTTRDRKVRVSSYEKGFETYSSEKKRFFSLCVLLGFTLVTLTVVVIGGIKYIHNLEGHLQNNQNTTQSNGLLLEKDTLIEKLNKTLIELQKQPSKTHTRPI